MKSVYHIAYHSRSNIWVVSERSFSYDRVVWIGVYIRNRSKIGIYPVFMQISAYRDTQSVCFALIARQSYLFHIGEPLHIKSIALGYP